MKKIKEVKLIDIDKSKRKAKISKKINKILKYSRTILFVTMITLTFLVSDKIAMMIESTSYNTIKTIVNILLVLCVMYLYVRKDDE